MMNTKIDTLNTMSLVRELSLKSIYFDQNIFFEIILLKIFEDYSFDRKSIIGSVEVL